jgi:hypothetical protein
MKKLLALLVSGLLSVTVFAADAAKPVEAAKPADAKAADTKAAPAAKPADTKAADTKAAPAAKPAEAAKPAAK